MRYLKQFAIIILISLMGELLSEFLPFSMPASIYGLLIMLVLLITGIIKVEHVKETSTFLLDIMPIMFIPPAVGLMDNWGILKEIILPLMLIGTASTIVVMVVTGRVTQGIIRKKTKENVKQEDV
ncbi:MAG: CidA/LrgA family protein [Lachnospiraceae bacterium]|nr:CidA/LrgA family protein [Lachnospiraceae bacterium]